MLSPLLLARSDPPRRARGGAGCWGLWLALLLAVGAGALPAVADLYDAPANYYASATGTGATLKQQLYTITKTGFTYQNYGDSRYALGFLWQDPSKPANTFVIYSGESVSGTWDAGATWNREHIATENSLGIKVTNAYVGYGSDLFDLAPAVPLDNSTRGASGYGYTGSTSTPGNTTYGRVTGTDGKTYWYAGDAWKGDVARSLFYMATRYSTGQGTSGIDSGNKYNLTLANGAPNATGQMGDLNSLLHWAYEDAVDTFERRKNSLTYSGLVVDGTDYSQGNRNPYIDHPEYIWAVFGTKANTSTLSVATPAAGGASALSLNLGRVIAGTGFTAATATLTKTGDTPTTFNVTTSGAATASLAGTGEAFTYDAASRTTTVDLATSAVAGAISGTVTVQNTDLTSAGAGQGSVDGNDVITLSGTALDHSNASFLSNIDSNHLTIDFGTLAQHTGMTTRSFSIFDLLSASGFTAGLDLDGLTATGSTKALFATVSTFSNLAAGSSLSFLAELDTNTPGSFSTVYTLAVSDENIPGATADTSLTLSLTGTISPAVPEPGTVSLVLLGLVFSAGQRLGRRGFRVSLS